MNFVRKNIGWKKYSNEFSIVILNEDWYEYKEKFILEKVDYLSTVSNLNIESFLSIIEDINNMVAFDLEDSTPLELPSQFICKGDENAKKKYILYVDYANLLGTVFFYVAKDINKSLRILQGKNGMVSTQDMLKQALNDLEYRSKRSENPYGATLSLATLIERQLVDSVSQSYKKEFLKILYEQKLHGQIQLENTDDILFDFLYLTYIEEKEFTVEELKFDVVYATTKLCFDLFLKYNIIAEKDKSSKFFKYIIAGEGFYGFNELLTTEEFYCKYDPRLSKCLQNIYLKKNMNLRNNLAHCSYGNLNYFDSGVSYLLYCICLILTI